MTSCTAMKLCDIRMYIFLFFYSVSWRSALTDTKFEIVLSVLKKMQHIIFFSLKKSTNSTELTASVSTSKEQNYLSQ